jgi:uroporphyrinogen decarboxylase
MRQAGRYLPEYRELRTRARSFLDFCYTPSLAVEATLQPIRRFQFDAAIVFCDILVVPDALGQKVQFFPNEGPRLDPIKGKADLAALKDNIDLNHLAPVFEAIAKIKALLPKEVALIGFCGAPWTVASYMIAGQGTPDQAPARIFAYREPDIFQILIDRLVNASIAYLCKQIEAGVETVQIFDTWAGVLPVTELERWCIAPVKAIVAGVKHLYPQIPVIGFPKAIGQNLSHFAQETGVNVLGLDPTVDLDWAADTLDPKLILQGNLDPLALLAGGLALEEGVARIKTCLGKRPYIFNLGHGILPQTPIAHVEHLLKLLRSDQ